MGNAADVDFGDVLDYLAVDRQTDAILLYMEGIQDARAFMSGLRTAARAKPVIVLKVAKNASGLCARIISPSKERTSLRARRPLAGRVALRRVDGSEESPNWSGHGGG